MITWYNLYNSSTKINQLFGFKLQWVWREPDTRDRKSCLVTRLWFSPVRFFSTPLYLVFSLTAELKVELRQDSKKQTKVESWSKLTCEHFEYDVSGWKRLKNRGYRGRRHKAVHQYAFVDVGPSWRFAEIASYSRDTQIAYHLRLPGSLVFRRLKIKFWKVSKSLKIVKNNRLF